MTEKTLTIGALARLTRTNPALIRLYEGLGLLPPPLRPGQSQQSEAAGARVYDSSDVRRLIFLRRCRDLGVLNPSLKLLTVLIDSPQKSNKEVQDLARTLLGNVQDQVKELTELAEILGGLMSGAGEKALRITDIDTTPIDDVKRMRRQVRKPLKTPSRG